MNKKGLLLSVIGLGLATLIALYIWVYKPLFSKTSAFAGDKKVLFIASGMKYSELEDTLLKDSFIYDLSAFQLTAKLMRFSDEKIRPGRYIIQKSMTTRELVGKLRSGNQDAQRVVINNIRLISDLAGKAARYFETDSLTFLRYLSDPATAQQYGFKPEQFLTLFLPNTYEMFWTTTPEKFVTRMKKEYDAFWDEEKRKLLTQQNLDPVTAYIVASIVEKESNYNPEKPAIAGVYLNRLKNGDKLQADPTVVYATGDFTIQRVLYEHLKLDSPYNTYLYSGLPPGPICMPSMASLNAVVRAEKHNYYFFCAKADNSGVHVFAETYNEHLKNADAFARWLNERNIK